MWQKLIFRTTISLILLLKAEFGSSRRDQFEGKDTPVGRPPETLQSPPPPRAKILQSKPHPRRPKKIHIILLRFYAL